MLETKGMCVTRLIHFLADVPILLFFIVRGQAKQTYQHAVIENSGGVILDGLQQLRRSWTILDVEIAGAYIAPSNNGQLEVISTHELASRSDPSAVSRED